MNEFREPIVLKNSSSLDDKLNTLKKNPFANKNDIYMLEMGIFGEKQVEYHLTKSNIGMYIMRDINLEIDNLKCQIDFVVVTSHHCYFIESKNYNSDIIYVDENRNFEISSRFRNRFRRRGIKSPLSQVDDQLAVFQRLFLNDEENVNKIFGGINFKDYFKTLVVFTNPSCRINSRKAPNDIKYKILKVDNLIRQIEYDNKHSNGINLSQNQMNEIANYFILNNKEIEIDTIPQIIEYIDLPIKKIKRNNLFIIIIIFVMGLILLIGSCTIFKKSYKKMTDDNINAINNLKDVYNSSKKNGFDLYNYNQCIKLKELLDDSFYCTGLPMKVSFNNNNLTINKDSYCYYLKYDLENKKVISSYSKHIGYKDNCSGIDVGLINYDPSNKYLEKIGGYDKVLEMARFAHNYNSGFDNYYNFSNISKRGGNPSLKQVYKDKVDGYFGTISNKGKIRLKNTLEDFNVMVEYYYYIMK